MLRGVAISMGRSLIGRALLRSLKSTTHVGVGVGVGVSVGVDVDVDEDFLTLSIKSVGKINSLVRSSKTLLNGSQCRDLSSKLVKTIENVKELVSDCGESLAPFTPALRDLHKILEKARLLVCDSAKENLCEASVFQLQNNEEFQEILLEVGLCYHVIYEQAKGMDEGRVTEIQDIRQSSMFSPAPTDEVSKDQALLRKSLEEFQDNSEERSNSWMQSLARYLLRRLNCITQHGQTDDMHGAILWENETEPSGTWKYLGLLGSGSGASAVCRTEWLGIPCAKKVFLTELEMAFFVNEARIMSSLSHPNIVKFFCCSNGRDKGQCFIGMELMEMSLSDLIKKQAEGKVPFPLLVALDIMMQIARGMGYLHDLGIAHRDLKPSNVVVNKLATVQHLDDCFCVKVADFGMSKIKVEASKSITISFPGAGTTRYRAPEIHPEANPRSGDKTNHFGKANWFKADVYSFAMVFAELISLITPFQDVVLPNIYEELVRGGRPELPRGCPEKLVALLNECWDGAPQSRPKFVEICTRLEEIRHDLLRGPTITAADGELQPVRIDPSSYEHIKLVIDTCSTYRIATARSLLNGSSPHDTQVQTDTQDLAGPSQTI